MYMGTHKYFIFSVNLIKIAHKKTDGVIRKTVTKFIKSTSYPTNSDDK